MNLVEYRKLTGLTPKQLALVLEISMQSVYNYLDGGIPAPHIAEQMEKNTNGRLNAKKLMEGIND